MDNKIWVKGIIYLQGNEVVNCSKEVAELHQLTYGMIFPVIIILGILGNTVNLIVLSRPLLQAIPYMFAKSRAVSDLLAILSFIPFLLQMTKTTSVWDDYPIAFYYAKLQSWIMYSLLGTSALYVTAFTMERYLFLSNPLKTHLDWKHRKKTLLAIIFIPLLMPLFHVAYYFNSEVIITNTTQYGVREIEETVEAPAYIFYILTLQLLFRIGPILTVILLNISSFIEYRKILKKRLQLTINDSTVHQKSEEKRMILLLLGTSLAFLVCNSPAAALPITINYKFLKCQYGFQLFRAVSNMLDATNCAIPVIIYLVFSADYRKTVSSLIFKPVRVALGVTEQI